MRHYDFIIAGAGCAGLSLAYQILHSPLRDRSILLIDRDDKDQNDRTWAFWTDRPIPLQSIVHREWRQLRFIADDGVRLIPTDPWRYVMIRGDDYYRHIRGLLAACPNIVWLKAPIRRIEDREDGAVVWIDADGHGPAPETPLYGAWAFDSLFNISSFAPDPRSTLHLQQYFKGWYIETPDDRFDPSAATIFDFRTEQAGEMRFFYVLPTTTRTALVEYVGLSLVDFDALRDRYLREQLGITSYQIISDEIGVTPMTDHPFSRQTGSHVMAVGIQGGLVKPTTGYAYTRIQEDSEAIVTSLLAYGHPFAVPMMRRASYHWLDSVMLEVMLRDPERLKPAFQAMFKSNPGPRIFRFLDERATPGDIARLVLTLPKLPFLAGAARLALARLHVRLFARINPSEGRITAESLNC